MNEDTLVKTMPLPYGQEWLWIADANMVILSPCLDEAGRKRALCEVSAHWRQSCLRVVPDDANVACPPTEPFALPRQSAMEPMGQQ